MEDAEMFARLEAIQARDRDYRAALADCDRLIADRDRLIADLAAGGCTYSVIAEHLGVHKSRIGQIVQEQRLFRGAAPGRG